MLALFAAGLLGCWLVLIPEILPTARHLLVSPDRSWGCDSASVQTEWPVTHMHGAHTEIDLEKIPFHLLGRHSSL